MKNVKTFLALILVLAMALCLCACGEDTPEQTDPSQDTNASVTDPTETEPSETEPSETEPSKTEPTAPASYDYSITVQDVDGNPFEGVFVQLCRGESCCLPGFTDANGVAYYSAADLVGEGDLIAKINAVPANYELVDGIGQITLTDGVVDVVFVLEPIAPVEDTVDADYSITVQTVDGTPIENVFVQLCRGESCCLPGFTDANGAAYFYEADLIGEGDLVAKISVIPAGYTAVDSVSQITLTDGLTDVVFVLETISADA